MAHYWRNLLDHLDGFASQQGHEAFDGGFGELLEGLDHGGELGSGETETVRAVETNNRHVVGNRDVSLSQRSQHATRRLII